MISNKNELILQHDRTKEYISWSPSSYHNKAQNIEVFESKERIFQRGEQIRWTMNNKAKGIINTETATITNISRDSVTLVTENGEKRTFAKQDEILRHVDYAYVSTVHASQGKTVDHVIAILESNTPYLTNQKTFYVELSRARKDVTLIIDNEEKVLNQLQNNSGDKITAIDSVKDHTEHKNAQNDSFNKETAYDFEL